MTVTSGRGGRDDRRRKHWPWPVVGQDGWVLAEAVQDRRGTKAKRLLVRLLKLVLVATVTSTSFSINGSVSLRTLFVPAPGETAY
jgi:hypothetical protein